MLRSYPVPLRPSWKWAGSCEIYGLKVFGTNLLNWIISNADTVCISASVGIPNLGLYNRVQALTVLPLGAVLSSVNTVLFSAYSRKQSDPGAIARVYLGVTGGFCTCVFPLYAGLAAIPALTVTSVFGAKYQSAAIVFAPAALISCTMCLIAAAGPVLWALNRVEQELLSAAVFAPTLILILAFFSGGSLRGVAYCMLGVFVARALVATALVVRCLHLSVRDIWDVWYPGIILSACTFVASKCSSALLHRVFASQIIVFLLVAGFTGGTGALLVIFFPRAFVPTVTLQRISGWALGPRSSVIAAVRGFAFRLSRAR
jgi:O-antigen/teichoic acid export membrane protein